MKQNIEGFPDQCKTALNLGKGIKIGNINRVMVTGMGGSGFAGEVLKTIAGEEIEIHINRDYFLPKKLDQKTLVFVISYSGNTEETISAAKDAVNESCQIVGISSGGELEKFCRDKTIPYIKVPGGLEPRNALGYLTIPMINVLEENGLIQNKNIENLAEDLNDKAIKQKAKKLAARLFKKIPLIYSSERLKCVSYGWKTRINENTKIHAFSHQIPELDHNELVGYTKRIGNFFAVIIRDKDDFERNKKRFEMTKRLIEKYKSECLIIDTIGTNLVSRIFCMLYLADWTSYFLALKYKVDPVPVKIIEDLKEELKK